MVAIMNPIAGYSNNMNAWTVWTVGRWESLDGGTVRASVVLFQLFGGTPSGTQGEKFDSIGPPLQAGVI